jgi:hypothetical protein
MKKDYFNIVKYLSLFFGLAFILGFFWYSAKPELKAICYILFNVSTGFALLVTPFVPDKFLKYLVVKIVVLLLIIIGIINNLYMMYGDLTFVYEVDWPAFILHLIAMCLLSIIIWRTIKPESIRKPEGTAGDNWGRP